MNTNFMSAFRQPFVALVGLGGMAFSIGAAMLFRVTGEVEVEGLTVFDAKTPVVMGAGFATAMITKAATSFGQGAPNTATALFFTFGVTVLAVLGIVEVRHAIPAMMDSGLGGVMASFVGLFGALLGAAQDRPKD